MKHTIIKTDSRNFYQEYYGKKSKHSPEFLAKQKEREEAKLKERLIVQIKTEDPRNFINDNNIIRLKRLPNEIYKLIPGTTRYYVSNLGNAIKIVYDKSLDLFLEHKLSIIKSKNKTNKFYSDIYIQNEDGERIKCRLSRAIAKTFIDGSFPLLFNTNNDKRVVDHIDNNSENNKLTNLRIVNQSGNLKAAIYEQGKTVGIPVKKCYAYNVNTKELRDYPSTAELSEDIFGSRNPGYFNVAYRNKSTTKHGWRCSYNKEDFNEN